MDSELTRQPQQLALPKLLPFGGNPRFQRERGDLNTTSNCLQVLIGKGLKPVAVRLLITIIDYKKQ